MEEERGASSTILHYLVDVSFGDAKVLIGDEWASVDMDI